MADENLFLDEQHEGSRRFAVLEDDGTSAWLYLTEPDSQKPIADAWVYNRIAAPPAKDIQSYRGGPPPAAEGYAGKTARCEAPEEHDWTFLWSADGESVAVLQDGEPIACIVAGHKGGYSRGLQKEGAWGKPWSKKVFATTFQE